MWEKIDTWVGKTLFVPIIIRICQKTGINQYYFHRICWALAWFIWLYRSDSIFLTVLCSFFAMFAIIGLALWPDSPKGVTSMRFLRMMWLVLLCLNLVDPVLHVMFGEGIRVHGSGIITNVSILFAEYAATIKTIPPLEDKVRVGRLAPAKRSA